MSRRRPSKNPTGPPPSEPPQSAPSSRTVIFFTLLLPVILALAFNFNVLQNGFGWDDETIIPRLKSSDPIWNYFIPNLELTQSEKSTHRYYRPLVGISYRLDFMLWGGQPFGFHFSVWLAHALNTLLVVFITRRLLGNQGTPPGQTHRSAPTRMGDSPDSGRHALRPYDLIPLIAGSLFAIHPLHAEAVAWIAGRNDVFCTTFLLISFFLYMKTQTTETGKTGNWKLITRTAYGFSMLFFFLALETKELAVAIILMFPLYDVLVLGSRTGRTHGSAPTETIDKKKGRNAWRPYNSRLTTYVLRFIPPLLILGLYFGLRAAKMVTPYGGSSVETVLSPSAWIQWITGYGYYLKLMFLPYPHTPFIASIPSSPFWVVISVLLLALMGGAWIGAVRQGHRLLTVALAWIILMLAPGVSVSVIRVASTPAAERYAYAATVGWVILVAWAFAFGLQWLLMRDSTRRWAWPFAAGLGLLLLVGWGAENWKRNAAWESPLTFWQAAVAASPTAGFPYRELGKHYAAVHREEQAEIYYKKAIETDEKNLNPNHPDVATNLHILATLYYGQAQYQQAEPLFIRALQIRKDALHPDHLDTAYTMNNLALLYYSQGAYKKAKPLYREAIGIYDKSASPDLEEIATSLNNLAAVYHAENQFDEAERLYTRSLGIKEDIKGPNSTAVASSLNNLAALYYAQGRFDEAKDLFQRALTIKEERLNPSHPKLAPTLSNIASIAYDQGRYDEAEEMLKRAIAIREKTLDPHHPKLKNNLEMYAKVLRKMGRLEEAQKIEDRLRTQP